VLESAISGWLLEIKVLELPPPTNEPSKSLSVIPFVTPVHTFPPQEVVSSPELGSSENLK